MPAQAWVTLLVGLFAAIGVLISWRQKVEADRRAEWWRQISWSFDQILSEDNNRASFGWLLLERLKTSELATHDDKKMFVRLAEEWLVSDDDDESAEGDMP